jgi:hypothetical protein
MRYLPLLFAAAVLAPAARADETGQTPPAATPDPIVALEAQIEAHKKAKDDISLTKDLDEIAKAHKAAADPKERARVNALFGAILRGAKNDEFEKAVLKTIGDLGDEENWKYVRGYVKQPDAKVAPPLLLEGIEAAGRIRADGAVDTLLRIVEKSKVYPAAAAAMKALGSYGDKKRIRAKVLEEIIMTVRKNVPGSKGGAGGGDSDSGAPPGGQGDASRWGTLAPALVEAANRLTGQTAATPEDWFDLYDRNKGKLEGLFKK